MGLHSAFKVLIGRDKKDRNERNEFMRNKCSNIWGFCHTSRQLKICGYTLSDFISYIRNDKNFLRK